MERYSLLPVRKQSVMTYFLSERDGLLPVRKRRVWHRSPVGPTRQGLKPRDSPAPGFKNLWLLSRVQSRKAACGGQFGQTVRGLQHSRYTFEIKWREETNSKNKNPLSEVHVCNTVFKVVPPRPHEEREEFSVLRVPEGNL